MSLTPHQQAVYDKIQTFLSSDGGGIFILKGYAGTGKTFLLQHLAQQLADEKKDFSLHASTGRAATILKAKMNFKTTTVHSELYQFSKVDGDYGNLDENAGMEEYGPMKLLFQLRGTDIQSGKIYIIDEASMLSDLPDNGTSFASFGSGRLLSDLMTVAGANKIIFSGDPCQLPPVFGVGSPALTETWFSQQGYPVQGAELTDIIRQDEGNQILDLATRVRTMVQTPPPNKFPKIPTRDLPDIHLHKEYNMPSAYLDFIEKYGYYQGIAITQTNSGCNWINKRVRARRYGDENMILMPGDILMVTQNNYLVPLTNGDLAEVVSLGEKRIYCNLSFINGRVKALIGGQEYEILICQESLLTGKLNLTPDQQKYLMVDFAIRMQKMKIKPNTEQYKNHLSKDPYLNSLRVSYGYAITCHKAQGGEWNDVFLFLNSYMFSMEKEQLLRWWYTGITRAKKELYLADDLTWVK